MEEKTTDVGVPHQADEATPETGTPASGVELRLDVPQDKAASIPKTMTLREFKRLRAQYFTVRHTRMEPCGHRLDSVNEPRNNCEYCWFAFFQTHGELVQTADRAYQEQGAQFLDKMRGRKFRVMFLRFMSTVAMFKKEIEEAKANEQARKIEEGGSTGQGLGQEVRDQGNIPAARQESGPVAASLPNFTPLV